MWLLVRKKHLRKTTEASSPLQTLWTSCLTFNIFPKKLTKTTNSLDVGFSLVVFCLVSSDYSEWQECVPGALVKSDHKKWIIQVRFIQSTKNICPWCLQAQRVRKRLKNNRSTFKFFINSVFLLNVQCLSSCNCILVKLRKPLESLDLLDFKSSDFLQAVFTSCLLFQVSGMCSIKRVGVIQKYLPLMILDFSKCLEYLPPMITDPKHQEDDSWKPQKHLLTNVLGFKLSRLSRLVASCQLQLLHKETHKNHRTVGTNFMDLDSSLVDFSLWSLLHVFRLFRVLGICSLNVARLSGVTGACSYDDFRPESQEKD